MTANSNSQTSSRIWAGQRWPVLSMIVAIIAITGFQGYWLKNNYDREKQNLDIKTSAAFRQTILRIQSSKLKLERVNLWMDSIRPARIVISDKKSKKTFNRRINDKEPSITLLNLIQEKVRDSIEKYDTINGVPVIALKGSGYKYMMADSIRKKIKDQLLTENFMGYADTALRGKGPKIKDQVYSITIDSRDNAHHKSSVDTQVEHGSTELVMQRPGENDEDIMVGPGSGFLPSPTQNNVFRFLYNVDSLTIKDSVTVKEVSEAYAARLKDDNINVGFTVSRLDSTQSSLPNTVTIGFSNPATFGYSLQHTFGYMFGKLKLPVLFSLLLLGITIASFVLLYRNMVKQQRLAELKNEFISNITHELKTPIATVGVAIEALKNFNAIDDPRRTREYLDISQNELQRLNLLVDKVLKLSIFEKKEIELKKELFDLKQLTEEVMGTMKLQFDKYGAKVDLQTEGDQFVIDADKLHITSVIYNLLDNALKYSKENPVIDVKIKSHEQHVSLSVKDNGIGIPAEYKGKIFEKFFRVPTGDRHNIKGYGLGLSYVSEVARRHQGFIAVESELGKGSDFTLNIPYKEAAVIQFDEHRKIVKKQVRFGH